MLVIVHTDDVIITNSNLHTAVASEIGDSSKASTADLTPDASSDLDDVLPDLATYLLLCCL